MMVVKYYTLKKMGLLGFDPVVNFLTCSFVGD